MRTNTLEAHRENVTAAIISAYREVISQKYTIDTIMAFDDVPAAFTPLLIDAFRDYLLRYSYPTPEQRDDLNDAFVQLDNYIKHPDKLIRLVLDSVGLLWKYGRHLPKILSAGLKALNVFRAANRFEQQLVEQAIITKSDPPYTAEKMNELIRTLSRKDVDDFIASSGPLFNVLKDRKLVENIKNIISELIDKMRSRPSVYPVLEIKGLEIGRQIISEGDELFSAVNVDDHDSVFNFIMRMESTLVDQIFNEG